MDTKLKCEMFSKYISTSTSYFLVKEQASVSKGSKLKGLELWLADLTIHTASLRCQLARSGTLTHKRGTHTECLGIPSFLFLNLSPIKLMSK